MSAMSETEFLSRASAGNGKAVNGDVVREAMLEYFLRNGDVGVWRFICDWLDARDYRYREVIAQAQAYEGSASEELAAARVALKGICNALAEGRFEDAERLAAEAPQ